MIQIETQRLIVRNFRPEDWQDLLEVAVPYQATEWARFEPPWPTEAEKVQGMARYMAGGDEFLAATLKGGGKLIGLIAVEPRKDKTAGIHNLGYVFHPHYWGQGYAAEGCRAAMAYMFEERGINAFLTGTRLENTPSVRLLERLGLEHLGQGEFRMTREEWQARQKA